MEGRCPLHVMRMNGSIILAIHLVIGAVANVRIKDCAETIVLPVDSSLARPPVSVSSRANPAAFSFPSPAFSSPADASTLLAPSSSPPCCGSSPLGSHRNRSPSATACLLDSSPCSSACAIVAFRSSSSPSGIATRRGPDSQSSRRHPFPMCVWPPFGFPPR